MQKNIINGGDSLENKQRNSTTQRSIFGKISDKLFELLKNGMFGYFFTSYDTANESYQKRLKERMPFTLPQRQSVAYQS